MKNKRAQRITRRRRVRAKITGTDARPRLSVFRSNTSLLVQIIDDEKGKTIISAKSPKTVEAAKTLGTEVAKLAASKGITTVVFDRGGYRYHGSIQALADAVRAGGIKF